LFFYFYCSLKDVKRIDLIIVPLIHATTKIKLHAQLIVHGLEVLVNIILVWECTTKLPVMKVFFSTKFLKYCCDFYYYYYSQGCQMDKRGACVLDPCFNKDEVDCPPDCKWNDDLSTCNYTICTRLHEEPSCYSGSVFYINFFF
jgi:hypothetical protein